MTNIPVPKPHEWKTADTIVWGIGRHGVRSFNPGHFTGFGSNNAAALERHLFNDLCNPATNRREQVVSKLIWLDTMVRTAPPVTADECPQALARFHEEVPRALERSCGRAPRVASVWGALLDAIGTQGSGWNNMTSDGVHWGLAPNILLAEAITEQMLQPKHA